MEIQKPTRGCKAFTLVELLVVIALIAVLVAIFLPRLRPIHPMRINCINNLKQDALAFKIWANDNGDKYPTQISITNGGAMELAGQGIAFPIFQVMSNEINTPKILHCWSDTHHNIATNFTTDFNNNKISYFVGLDASEQNPNSVLIGDDNFVVNGKLVDPGILNLATKDSVKWTNERIDEDKFHGQGNLAFADCSASQMNNTGWLKFVETNVTLNRLVIP